VRFVVDSSAVLAIRLDEPEREPFHRLLLDGRAHLSVATQAELALIWQARFGTKSLADLDTLLDAYAIALEPVTTVDAAHLRHAIQRFAKGSRSEPACLNFGDLFAYALARRLDLPLLFKGQDFVRTDVRRAWPD
jgi:ribonuclease VapC